MDEILGTEDTTVSSTDRPCISFSLCFKAGRKKVYQEICNIPDDKRTGSAGWGWVLLFYICHLSRDLKELMEQTL